ncbi:MAG: ComEC/Rec2 family competence protein [Candidatus Hodarchaeales archaeon]|jgi:competence protein ComEC
MNKFLWLFLILLIFFRYITTRPVYQDGDKVRITSKVTSEPVRYSDAQYLKVKGLRFYLPLYPEVVYGDEIVVEGLVENDKLKSVELIELESSSGILPRIRKRLVEFYQGSLPEPHSSLIAGVVLGSKASIPNKFWENLKKTGTAHVVVASGMNVSLVANFLLNSLVVVMKRRRAIVFALVGIWIYSIMSGFDAPIIRAAIMGSIAFSAQVLGRINYAWRGLFISALLMLVVKPDWISDYGFILSFIATASLLLFQKRIESRLTLLPEIIKQDFSTSLAAQIGVTPILYATFGQFNILSPLINTAILWTIVPITIMGMLAGIVSYISMWLGQAILILTYPMTLWFVGVVEFLS